MNHWLGRTSLLIHSIRFRLAVWFVVILGIVVALFSMFVYTRQAQELQDAANDRLAYKAEKLASYFYRSNHNGSDRTVPGILYDADSGASFLQPGECLAFVNLDGQITQSWGPGDAEWLSERVAESLEYGYVDRYYAARSRLSTMETETARLQYLTVLGAAQVDYQLTGYFLLGTPLDPDNQMPRLLVSLILGAASTLGVAMLGGFWLADRAIRPVRQITETARTIGETDLSLRLQLNQKDELGELADTFDAMLARLQAAFERQRRFTADASHELRTPLSIIELETSRALAVQRSLPEYERALRVIYSENQIMTRLVNNLLTLARIDAGQVRMDTQILDLSDLALEVVERLAPIARQEGVRLSTGDLPELPVAGDQQYLAQMLTNLVENGIKYSSHGGRVEVTCGQRASAAGPQAWVSVRDDGPGIPPEHRPFLFDRFYRVDPARSRTGPERETAGEQMPSGAGLGLAIALSIAKAHQGEIKVESEKGQGTTFVFSMPLAGSAAHQNQRSPQPG